MLTSLQNPLVKQLRKLHRAQERKQRQLCLLEGTHLLQEACVVGYPLETVCCTPQWQSRHAELWPQLSTLAERLEVVSEAVLTAIATTVNPDGVVATAKRLSYPPDQAPIATLGLALENLQDPGNVGTIMRTGAAVGVDALWLSAGGVEPDHPKVMRASAGQCFHLPIAVSSQLPQLLRQAQQQGLQVIATQPNASLSYWQIDLTRPSVILLGNEGAGLSAELCELADRSVCIPQQASTESLNVGITAALLLYEALRQRSGS